MQDSFALELPEQIVTLVVAGGLLPFGDVQIDLAAVDEELVVLLLDAHPSGLAWGRPFHRRTIKGQAGRDVEVDLDRGGIDDAPEWKFGPRVLLAQEPIERHEPLDTVIASELVFQISHRSPDVGDAKISEHDFRHGKSP